MKLFKLTQEDLTGYDTFDSCVVCAESEDDAKSIMPTWDGKSKPFEPSQVYGVWAMSIEGVKCEYIGEAASNITKGVVIASFNAG